MDELTQRIRNLPAELFNKIFEAAFTATSGDREITADYKPSHLLRVNHYSREIFAKTYYGSGTVIVFRNAVNVGLWLKKLTPDHHALMEKARYDNGAVVVDLEPPFEPKAAILTVQKAYFEALKRNVLSRYGD